MPLLRRQAARLQVSAAVVRIRLHGRGGHGIKTAGRIVGTAAFLAGHEVQDAPFYGAERRGAPVVAYVRVSDQAILERGVIDRPNLILIGDETLLADPAARVLLGQEAASAVFVNSPADQDALEQAGIETRAIQLDLTRMTAERLGRASALSVGLAAAAVKMSGCADKGVLGEAVREELAELDAPEAELPKNLELAGEVFDAVPSVELKARQEMEPTPLRTIEYEGAFAGTPSILAPGNAAERNTGAWRLEKPEVDYEGCTRCGLCFVECPDGAIALDEQGYPVIDYAHCKGCMICRELCPIRAIRSQKEVRAW